jgi:hypothetical protein
VIVVEEPTAAEAAAAVVAILAALSAGQRPAVTLEMCESAALIEALEAVTRPTVCSEVTDRWVDAWGRNGHYTRVTGHDAAAWADFGPLRYSVTSAEQSDLQGPWGLLDDDLHDAISDVLFGLARGELDEVMLGQT